MLYFMRKHAKFFYVFFFLVIISFIFLYVGPIDQNSTPVLAEVGKEKIYLDEFWRTYDKVRDFYRNAYQEKFNEEMEKTLNLKQKSLDILLEERVLIKKAEELGLYVSDTELQETIMNEPAFKREGVFRRDVYLRTLQLNRLTPKYYESMMKRELLLKKIRFLIVDFIDINDEEIKNIKGDQEFFDAIRGAMLTDKREKMIKSYVETLKKELNVKVYSELLS